MKKLTLILISIFVTLFAIVQVASASWYNPFTWNQKETKEQTLGASVLFPYQGGTGIGTATAGDVGKVIKVLDDSPFTYELATDNTGSGGGDFPFTVNTGYNSTSTVIGFNGLFSTASSTFSGNVFLPALTQGFLYTGSNGVVRGIASSSINLSWFNNDSAFITDGNTNWDNSYGFTTFAYPFPSAATTTRLTLSGGLDFPYSSSTIYSSFIHASTTNLTFGGVTADTWPEFCTAITGGAGLCDGSDDGAGGGTEYDFTYNTSLGYGLTGSATSTKVKFTLGLLASTTNFFDYASTTQLSIGSDYVTDLDGTGLTLSSGALNVDTSQNIATLSNLTTNGFVTTSGGNGTLSVTTLPIGYASGGTGSTTAPVGQLLYGGSTAYQSVATSSVTINAPLTSAGTAGYVVGGSGWTIDIDDIKAADLDLADITLNDFTNDAGFITSATSAYEIATTSDIAVPQLAYISKTGGRTTLASVATTTLTATSPLSLSQAVVKVGGSNSVLTISTTTNNLFSGLGGQILVYNDGLGYLPFSTTSIPLAGDVTGTIGSTVVGDNSHAHDGTTLSGIDISDDTNLAVTYPIIKTDDTLSFGWTYPFPSGATTTRLTLSGGLDFTYSSSTIYSSFITASSTTGLFGTASTSVLNALTSVNLFGGGDKTTANDLCTQLTGSADLCDGGDATGAGGSSKWATTTNLVGIYPSAGATTGVIIGGSATTTNTNLQVIGTTTTSSLAAGSTAIGSNVMKVSPLTGLTTSASESVGGVFNMKLGTTDAIGMVLHTDGTGSSRLLSVICDDPSYSGNCLHVRSDGTATALNVAGAPTGQGLIKAGANGVGDANASMISIDASTSGFLGQAMFMKCGSSSTCWNLRDLNNTQVVTVNKDGYYGLGTTTPRWQLQIATSSQPQLALSDRTLTSPHWTMRSVGGNFYMATASPTTFATSTLSFLNFIGGAGPFGGLGIASSTSYTNSALFVSGTTTIKGQLASFLASTTANTTQTINWSSGNTQSIMLTGNTSIVMNSTSSNPIPGASYQLEVCQDPTGSRTLSWAHPGKIRWGGINNATTTITSTANKCTWFGMKYIQRNDAAYYVILASSTNVDIKGY